MRFTMGLEMSHTRMAVGSIHLFDFQNAAPQNRSAAMGEKFARSGWLAVVIRKAMKIVAISIAAIQGRFIKQILVVYCILSKDNYLKFASMFHVERMNDFDEEYSYSSTWNMYSGGGN